LGAHYRSKLNFTFDALESAKNALENLYEKVRELKSKIKNQKLKIEIESKNYQRKFLEFINDDLDTPKALALMWDLISGNKIDDRQKYLLLLDFDRILGLSLEKIKKPKIPQEIRGLVKIREDYRKKGDFKSADEIREKIKDLGYWIEDTKEGPKIKKLTT
jgi:cysteinyl-tRNA synthetase